MDNATSVVLNASSSPVDVTDYQFLTVNVVTPGHDVTENASESRDNTADYEYEYDYYESMRQMPVELVPVGIVYGLTFLLGIVGNSLVIFTICRHRRMRSATNTFLVSLASADLMLVVVCIPIKLVKWFTFTWGLGEVLCKFVHYVQNVSVLCSVLTLTALSIERYYAIIFPMRAKYVCTRRRARRVVLLLWGTSVVLATPIIIGQIQKEVGQVPRTGFWCVEEWPRPVYEQVYDLFMLAVILCIPLSLMTFAYCSICNELWRTSRTFVATPPNGVHAMPLNSQTNSTYAARRSNMIHSVRVNSTCDTSQMRKQAVKMLVAVMVLFLVCWAPLLVDNVLVAFRVLNRLNYGPLKPIRQTFSLLAYANSCVNPIVYAFMSRSFRESFKAALCVCVERNPAVTFPHRREFTPVPSQSSFSASRGLGDYSSRSRTPSRPHVDLLLFHKMSVV